MRIDRYLKVSRLIKRRTVAAEACDGGRVSVNGKTVKPSYDVKMGDMIAVQFGQRRVCVEVTALQENTGKADAAGMYREVSPAERDYQ